MVRILKDLDKDITGRRVLIVEDIIDSGLTLSWLLKNLHTRNPASIEVVALLRKPEAVKVDVDVRYVGFDIPNEFVVGYGLDYAERYRDLPVRRPARPEAHVSADRPVAGTGTRRAASPTVPRNTRPAVRRPGRDRPACTLGSVGRNAGCRRRGSAVVWTSPVAPGAPGSAAADPHHL